MPVFYALFYKLLPGFSVMPDAVHISALLVSVCTLVASVLGVFFVSKDDSDKIRRNKTLYMLVLTLLLAVVVNQSFLYLFHEKISSKYIYVLVSYIFSLWVCAVPFLLYRNKNTTRLQVIAYVGVFVIAVLSLWAALDTGWYNLNPDGVSYYSIAEHYAEGRTSDAINAYWSPMLSWLLVPFIWAGQSANTGYRVVMVLASLLACLGQYAILRRLLPRKSNTTKTVLYTTISLSMLFYISVIQSGLITPDMLTISWCVWLVALFVRMIQQEIALGTKYLGWGVLLGLLGASGFYIKGFLLPFYVGGTAVFVVFLWWLRKKSPWQAVRFYLVSTGVTLVLIVPWAAALHSKYGVWMTGSASDYNMSWVGPKSVKHPMSKQIIEPPHSNAVAAWEDPTNHPYVHWDPTQSLEDFEYHIFSNMIGTVKSIANYIGSWSFMSIILIVGTLFGVLFNKSKKDINSDERLSGAVVLAALSVVYIAGYIVIHMVGGDRYIWPVLIMNITLAGVAFSYLAGARKNASSMAALTIVVCLGIAQFTGLYVNEKLRANLRSRDGVRYNSLATALALVVPADSRVVSNDSSLGMYVSYTLDLKYYGVVKAENNGELSDANIDKLREYKIDYYFCLKTKSNCGLEEGVVVWESKNHQHKVFKVSFNE